MAEEERTKRAGAVEAAPSMGATFVMMENSLERLKLLNYETKYCRLLGRAPLDRLSFALPGPNPSLQLNEFLGLCSWIIELITRDPTSFAITEFDDPNTSVNKLMLALRNLDFSQSIPASRLKTPHGEAVCSVLEFLTEKALTLAAFQWQRPVYVEAHEVEDAEEDDAADAGIIEDKVEKADDEEVMFSELAKQEIAETSLDQTQHVMLEAQVDAVAWKKELERVGPKLKAAQLGASNEWRAHIDQTQSSKDTVSRVVKETSGDLAIIARDVSDASERLKTKEQFLNTQFDAIAREYKEVKSEVNAIESRYKMAHEKIGEMTAALADVETRLSEMKEQMASKDSNMSDSSPLVQIKTAMQIVKSDILSFDLRIGVVSRSLTQAKMNAARRKRRKANRSAGKRKANGAVSDDDKGSGDEI